MPSSISCGAAANGGCSRPIFRLTRPSTMISGPGAGQGSGSECTTRSGGPARGRGPHAYTECRDDRQPDGEDCGTRGLRGYDGAKRTRGRKRHIVVDVLGPLLVVMVHSAGIQDQDGAKQVLTALVARFPGLQLIWADGGVRR